MAIEMLVLFAVAGLVGLTFVWLVLGYAQQALTKPKASYGRIAYTCEGRRAQAWDGRRWVNNGSLKRGR